MQLQSVHQRLAKAHAAKASKVDKHSALVSQHTTQMLLPRIDKRIDDLQYENYNVPTMMYGARKIIIRDRLEDLTSTGYALVESDYVDARVEQTYEMEQKTFRNIKDSQELLKLQRVIQQLETILANKNVSDKRLRAVLTAEEYADYMYNYENASHPSEITYGDGMPSELHSYTSILRLADFHNNKFEKMHGQKSFGKKNFSSASITAVSNKAESLYEDALERLSEIFSSASPAEQYELQNWLDRDYDWDKGVNSTLTIDCGGVPRVRGSKSVNALDSGLPKLSKRLKRKECQLQVLRSAACAIAFVAKQEEDYTSNPIASAKLKALMAKLGRDDD